MHPSSIDACLQLIIISINAGKHKEMPWGVVPTRLQEVTLFPARVGQETSIGHAVAWTDKFEGRRFNTNVQLSDGDKRILLDIKDLTCTAYEAALPARSDAHDGEEAKGPEPFSVMSWKPDIETLRGDDMDLLWPGVSSVERLARCIGLIAHRQSITNALIIAPASTSATREFVDAILGVVPSDAIITIGVSGSDSDSSGEVIISDTARSRVQQVTMSTDLKNWETTSNGPHDFVVVDSHIQSQKSLCPETLLKLVGNSGWLIYPSSPRSSSSISSEELLPLRVNEHIVCQKTVPNGGNNGAHPCFDRNEEITVLLAQHDRSLRGFSDVLSRLQSRFVVHEKDLSEFPQGQSHHVIIDDIGGAVSAAILDSKDYFEACKQVLTSGVPVIWLTRGVRQGYPVGNSAVAGMVEGLLRVIRSEQAAVKLTLLDVDVGEEPRNICRAIIHAVGSTATKDSGRDTEFWLHRGVMLVSRVGARDDLNESMRRNQLRKVPLSGSMKLIGKAADGQFVFEPQIQREPATLDDIQVEIGVTSSSWPSYSPGSRMLVAGAVIRTGASVDRGLVGKRAVTFTLDTLQTVFPTSVYAIVGPGCHQVSSESLVHTISLLCPLVNLCLASAKLEKGDVVISLPGPEQDITVLARLSKAMGWRLSVVARNENDRALYASQGNLDASQIIRADDTDAVNALIYRERELSPSRVATVLAHEFDTHLAQEVWRHIPPSCRFLLLNDKPLETPLDPLPFSRSASFIPSSMRYLRESANAMSSLLATSLDLIEAHPSLVGAGTPYSIDVGDAKELSVKNPKDSSDINISTVAVPSSGQLRLLPNATYLLVGCLGGLGRSLTRWMMECGAKHFAFISRSGIDKPEAARLVADIESLGASTQVLRADAADKDAVAKIVASLQATRPVRGVVHAAMVLKDGMFEQMTHQSFVDCVEPKAHGALSLHKALESAGVDPDFFVMTSSISALLGNTGQANYSAANSALDALARQRRAAGLAATSLVLPMVLDVGVVADNDSIEASLVRKGLYGIDEHEMLRGFEVAILSSRPKSNRLPGLDAMENVANGVTDESQIIMGMEPRELVASAVDDNVDAYWHGDSRFCHTRAAMSRLLNGDSANGSKGGSGESNTFARNVKAAVLGGHGAVVKVVSEHIARRMSSILMIPFESFELDGVASIASYGLDSMIGAELRTWLFKEFGLDYPFQKLLASSLTFKKLSDVVIDKMGLLVAAE
ncbi:hypothetical protein O1611_g8471 [Lasiodiplodia mahajangana]|uniref:Uncharacterized protein n=1 Tax=Lasiodiplodia mahajangana TaxID=1108764 RepID=A0ACC2JCT1_9PEZI|nr:hypothetical protein O1611_g8471 [Lasiodiplodia mahajangana]